MFSQIRIRVAGVLSENGKVLLVFHEKKGDRYWLFPGGGVNFGESLKEALIREFREETNLEIKIMKLLFINETVAPDASRHGLHFTFLVKRKKGSLKAKRQGRLRGAEFVSWDALERYSLRPPLGKYILKAYRQNFKEPIQFLGNLFV